MIHDLGSKGNIVFAEKPTERAWSSLMAGYDGVNVDSLGPNIRGAIVYP